MPLMKNGRRFFPGFDNGQCQGDVQENIPNPVMAKSALDRISHHASPISPGLVFLLGNWCGKPILTAVLSAALINRPCRSLGEDGDGRQVAES